MLQDYISQLMPNPQIEMTRSMTLKQFQESAGDAPSDATLANKFADIAELPAN